MVVLNLMPPNAGGGLQNALSFLKGLESRPDLAEISVVCCVEGGEIHRLAVDLGVVCRTFKSGVLGRFRFELFGFYAVCKEFDVRLVFTLFGNRPLFSPGVYSISGFALSNILQPEVDFWSDFVVWRKFYLKFKDKIRFFTALRSDELIFETEYLLGRARETLFRRRKLHVVKMQPSNLVLDALAANEGLARQVSYGGDFLCLSGAHPNKRIHLLAPIFSELARLSLGAGQTPPRLMVSFNCTSSYAEYIRRQFELYGVGHLLRFIGVVPSSEVAKVVLSSCGVINIARLESFSNNWVEAWAAGVPLISTSAEWAVASCGNAALYIDPENSLGSAYQIFELYSSPDKLRLQIAAGKLQVSSLLAGDKKIDSYCRIIFSALNSRVGGA